MVELKTLKAIKPNRYDIKSKWLENEIQLKISQIKLHKKIKKRPALLTIKIGNRFKRKGKFNWMEHAKWLEKRAIPKTPPKKVFKVKPDQSDPTKPTIKPKEEIPKKKIRRKRKVGDRFKRKGPINWTEHATWLEKKALPKFKPKRIFTVEKKVRDGTAGAGKVEIGKFQPASAGGKPTTAKSATGKPGTATAKPGTATAKPASPKGKPPPATVKPPTGTKPQSPATAKQAPAKSQPGKVQLDKKAQSKTKGKTGAASTIPGKETVVKVKTSKNRFKQKGPIDWNKHKIWLTKNSSPKYAPKRIFTPPTKDAKSKKDILKPKSKPPKFNVNRFKRKGPINWEQHTIWLTKNSQPKWPAKTKKIVKKPKTTKPLKSVVKTAKTVKQKEVPKSVKSKKTSSKAKNVEKIKPVDKTIRFRQNGPINWKKFEEWSRTKALPKPVISEPILKRQKLPLFKLIPGTKRLCVPKWITKYKKNQKHFLSAPITKIKQSALKHVINSELLRLSKPKDKNDEPPIYVPIITRWKKLSKYNKKVVLVLSQPKTPLSKNVVILEPKKSNETLPMPRPKPPKYKRPETAPSPIVKKAALTYEPSEYITIMSEPKDPLPRNEKISEPDPETEPLEAKTEETSEEEPLKVRYKNLEKIAFKMEKGPKIELKPKIQRYQRPQSTPEPIIKPAALNYKASEYITVMAEPLKPLPKNEKIPEPQPKPVPKTTKKEQKAEHSRYKNLDKLPQSKEKEPSPKLEEKPKVQRYQRPQSAPKPIVKAAALNYETSEYVKVMAEPKNPLPKNEKVPEPKPPQQKAKPEKPGEKPSRYKNLDNIPKSKEIEATPKIESKPKAQRYVRPESTPKPFVKEAALQYEATPVILKLAEPKNPLPKIPRKEKPVKNYAIFDEKKIENKE